MYGTISGAPIITGVTTITGITAAATTSTEDTPKEPVAIMKNVNAEDINTFVRTGLDVGITDAITLIETAGTDIRITNAGKAKEIHAASLNGTVIKIEALNQKETIAITIIRNSEENETSNKKEVSITERKNGLKEKAIRLHGNSVQAVEVVFAPPRSTAQAARRVFAPPRSTAQVARGVHVAALAAKDIKENNG